MNITVQATQDFVNFLKNECSKNENSKNENPEIVKEKEITNEGKLQNFITMAPGDIMLSIVITYSPILLDLVKKYVKERNRNIFIKNKEIQKQITPYNIQNAIDEIKNVIDKIIKEL